MILTFLEWVQSLLSTRNDKRARTRLGEYATRGERHVARVLLVWRMCFACSFVSRRNIYKKIFFPIKNRELKQ